MRHILLFVSGLLFALLAVTAYAQFAPPGLLAPTIPMVDVNGSEWFGGPVKDVTSWGVMSADGNRMFRPGEQINRAQMAVIIKRYDDYLDGKFLTSKASDVRLAGDFLKRSFKEIDGMLNSVTAQNKLSECNRLQAYKQQFLTEYLYFSHQKEDLQTLGYDFPADKEPLVNEVQSSYSDGKLNDKFRQVCGA